MNKIINEILTLPGVLGTCVLNTDQTILLSKLPATFTDGMASDVGANIGRMTQMAKVKGMEPQTITINYDTFIVLVLTLEDDTLLIVICNPSCSISLVTTTAYMLGPELVKTLQDMPSQAANTDTQPTPQEPSSAEPDPKTSQALDYIKQSLFETIGPIAEMVYDDCLERWTTNSPADISRIFELVGCISTEIDNPDLFNEFKGKIASLL